ncbi:hypothetical protein VP1G_10552 [Cytospora mali]|uniref:Uncharacterized protein n=1 Tax=Cytospora mali TaxID=578113 RepID=A0A194UMX3_CYTMA|nr:hypothetical protein VP1G_10552 [Valsa mali var. pyri (nom. inval.)]
MPGSRKMAWPSTSSPSSTSSQMTPAGLLPASRQNSVAASRQHVSRPPEALGLGGRVRQRPARHGAVARADARRDRGVGRVDGQGVGGGAGVLVAGHHLREVEGLGELGDEGRAYVARGVSDHEGHLLGRDVLGRDDQVGLVLAAWVVEDYYELAITCGRIPLVQPWPSRGVL